MTLQRVAKLLACVFLLLAAVGIASFNLGTMSLSLLAAGLLLWCASEL